MDLSLRIASRSVALTLLAALIACVPLSAMAAASSSHGDIVVVTVHGTVNATMAGMTVPLSAGAILQLPATVRTGADGAVELRQGPSTFAAAGNTELEIPQSAAQDGLIERIVQIRGNAFYSIGKRTGTRLRVEAPYLVAVIKGTQFNVAAQEDSTTIALFEGHLEVRASDDSDVVDLDAGEIAIRRRNDVSINVLRLNAARADSRRNQELAARQQPNSPAAGAGTVVARDDTAATNARPRNDTPSTTESVAGSGLSTTPERGRIVDAIADTSAPVSTKPAIDLGANASVDAPGGAVDVSVGAGAAIGGAASVDAGVSAAVDLGAGSVAAAGDVGVAAGPVTTDVGTSAAIDVSAGTVDVGVSGTVAATGALTVDTGVGAAVDVGSGAVDVATGAAVAVAGTPTVDVGAGAAIEVPAGTVDVGVDTTVAGTNVGAEVGVDAGAGNVGAEVGVAGVNVGVELGTGGVGLDVGTDSGGGLLGGLGGLLGGGRKRN